MRESTGAGMKRNCSGIDFKEKSVDSRENRMVKGELFRQNTFSFIGTFGSFSYSVYKNQSIFPRNILVLKTNYVFELGRTFTRTRLTQIRTYKNFWNLLFGQ